MPRSQRILLGCTGVIAVSIAVLLGGALLWNSGGSLNTATRAELGAAEAKWKRTAPDDYDITVEVGGRRAATYRVEVRGGTARAAWLNDRPISQRRLFSVWSVPGMFDTIGREFDLMESSREGKPGTPRDVRIQCRWHAHYGFPQSYQRLAAGGDEIFWEVTRFVPNPEGGGA